MSSTIAKNFITNDPKLKLPSLTTLCKSLAISTLILYTFSTLLSTQFHCQPAYNLFTPSPQHKSTPTNITHLVFSIAGSINTLKHKKPYVQSWWQPNKNRGYLFLDREPSKEFMPWPSSLPPFKISDDISKFEVYKKHVMAPHVIRIVRMILEIFREENEGVRWYVMGDDDTIFFVDNLVEVLGRYDYSEKMYVGANSESVKSNFDHSFDMAFGGAGFALSYPLVAALAGNLDGCIKRYPYLYVSDHILQSCLADLGVSLTHDKGFHQIDLHNDISGLLSAHPQSPLLSLHHLDAVNPIFPSMNRFESVTHLMNAAKQDQSRLLQQTICYHKQSNWSFSISWGFSAHIYETIFPPSFLRRPLETFTPWKRTRLPFFMFNTRFLSNDPCEAPHVFFFDSIENATTENQIVMTYVRSLPRGLPACGLNGNHSADFVSKIQVFSPMRHHKTRSRRECCDVRMTDMNVTEVKLRTCKKDEIVA